jgi:hypothetical protein
VEAARSADRVTLEGLRIIAKLFVVDRESTLAGDNAEDRRDRRQAKSRPVLHELRAWIDRQSAVTPPKTPLGKGLRYLDRQCNRRRFTAMLALSRAKLPAHGPAQAAYCHRYDADNQVVGGRAQGDPGTVSTARGSPKPEHRGSAPRRASVP